MSNHLDKPTKSHSHKEQGPLSLRTNKTHPHNQKARLRSTKTPKPTPISLNPTPLLPHLLQRQPAIQKLRPPLPKTPILLPILGTRNNQLFTRNITLPLQRLSQLSVKFLFGVFIAALLEDLDEDELGGAFVV